MTSVVVVGGGIAGLAAAQALAKAGTAVTVVESSDRVGGKLRISEVAGVPVDEGAEMFLRRVPEALELVRASAGSAEVVSPRTTSASVWARGALRPIPAGTVMGVPSDAAALRGVLSAGEVARVALDRYLPGAPPGGDVSLWPVGHEAGGPSGRGAAGGPAAGWRVRRTCRRAVRRGDAPAAATRRTVRAPAARRATPPPARHPDPVFATVTGGLGTVPAGVAAAIEHHGGVVVTGRTVRRLERRSAGWRAVHGPTIDEQAIDADAVVVAVPAAPAARLLAPVAPAAASELAAIEAASMAIVTTAWRDSDAPTARQRLPGPGGVPAAGQGGDVLVGEVGTRRGPGTGRS